MSLLQQGGDLEAGTIELPQLTDEEIAAVVLAARKKKRDLIEAEARRKAYIEQLNRPLFPPINSPEDLLAFAIGRMPAASGLEIDEENRSVVYTLLSYFSGIQNEFTEGMSFEKGILLFGGIGTGKTTLMELLRENPHAPFMMRAAWEIANEFQEKEVGVKVIEKYGVLVPNQHATRFFSRSHIGLCIDDAGTENKGMSFGNTKNVIAEILQARYQNINGPYTHLTTNLDKDELKNAYGLRVFDRMRQMFNIVEYPENAKSRRK